MEKPTGQHQEFQTKAGRHPAVMVAAIAAFLMIPFGGMSVILVLHEMLRVV